MAYKRTEIAKFNQLEMRSPTMRELIAQKPSFLSRFSMIIFGVILLCLICFSWVIRFEDSVTAQVYFVASNTISKGQLYATALLNSYDAEKIDSKRLVELTMSFTSDTPERHFKGYINSTRRISSEYKNSIEVNIVIIDSIDFKRVFQERNYTVVHGKAKIITKSKRLIDKIIQDILGQTINARNV